MGSRSKTIVVLIWVLGVSIGIALLGTSTLLFPEQKLTDAHPAAPPADKRVASVVAPAPPRPRTPARERPAGSATSAGPALVALAPSSVVVSGSGSTAASGPVRSAPAATPKTRTGSGTKTARKDAPSTGKKAKAHGHKAKAHGHKAKAKSHGHKAKAKSPDQKAKSHGHKAKSKSGKKKG